MTRGTHTRGPNWIDLLRIPLIPSQSPSAPRLAHALREHGYEVRQHGYEVRERGYEVRQHGYCGWAAPAAEY